MDVEQTNLGPVGKLTADAAADSTYTSYGQGNSYMPTLAETGSDWGETWNNVVTGLIAGNTLWTTRSSSSRILRTRLTPSKLQRRLPIINKQFIPKARFRAGFRCLKG